MSQGEGGDAQQKGHAWDEGLIRPWGNKPGLGGISPETLEDQPGIAFPSFPTENCFFHFLIVLLHIFCIMCITIYKH